MSPAEAKVRAWGYPHVFTWADAPNTHYPPHTHRVATTHLILDGTLTIAYPADREGGQEKGEGEAEKVTWGEGARIDVPAGRVHEVWVGGEGCRGWEKEDDGLKDMTLAGMGGRGRLGDTGNGIVHDEVELAAGKADDE